VRVVEELDVTPAGHGSEAVFAKDLNVGPGVAALLLPLTSLGETQAHHQVCLNRSDLDGGQQQHREEVSAS